MTRRTKGPSPADPSRDLAELAEAYWQACLEDSPVFATGLGIPGHDDRLSDLTPAGRARWTKKLEAFLDRARTIPEDGLSPEDRITRSELVISISTALDEVRCDLEAWTVDPLGGPVVAFLNLEAYQPAKSLKDARNMVARWRAMGPYLGVHVTNLRRGLEAGKVAVRAGVAKVLEQIDDLSVKRVEDWPLLKPLRDPRRDWATAARTKFKDDLLTAVRDGVRPAVLRLGEALRT